MGIADLPAELTVTEVANLLGVHRDQILRRIHAGTLKAFRPLKRDWRIHLSELRKHPDIWQSIRDRVSSS